MTEKERKKIRESIAHSIIKVSEVKETLKLIISEFDLPPSIHPGDNDTNKYGFEINALNQAWNNIFTLWEYVEEVMQLDYTTYDEINKILVEQLPNLFHDLNLIKESIYYKSSDESE